ncbi:MAG: DNA mismatch repair protein MutS [Lactovum sp.]
MQQYLDIKAEHPDAFLLFRMGDFYELFYDDAVNAAQLLELTLTSRNKNSESPIPMAGVPHHAAMEYIEKLVEAGYKVAIAEQIENPKEAVGIVKRAVTQVITPGTTVDTLSGSDNNFLVAIDKSLDCFELAYIDLATGEFKETTFPDFSSLLGEVSSLRAREILVAYDLSETERQIFEKQLNLLISVEKEGETLSEKLLNYIQKTQRRSLSHLQEIEHYELSHFLQMDFSTKIALELIVNRREGKKSGTLYALLDMTKTAMGTRMLKSWIDRPLIDLKKIRQRQDIVQLFIHHFFEREDLIQSLRGVYDLERLVSRLSFGKAVPADLLQLSHSLQNIPKIRGILESIQSDKLASLIKKLDDIPELLKLIEESIDENAQRIITEGGIIKKDYHKQLDTYREALTEGNNWRLALELEEKEKTEISTLKIDYNRQDGYYFHVTASQLNKVPDYFIYKKALKNATRYTTKELEDIETKILEAREKSSALEYDLFSEIREKALNYISRLQSLAKIIAAIDCLQSLATVAEKQQYVRPTLQEFTREVKIKKGRHAVVETVMNSVEYVPNDILMLEDTDIQLITGPNMSGKSTYMRQFALLVIMAQIGSFIPAQEAEFPVFDAIFTRIGASDNLLAGESTFMVEMSEANYAIQKASSRSLILFDELGRGTSTYDGMALAQAIIEYIHENIKAKTLFATHYHELTKLDESLLKLKNVHVSTLEKEGEVTFLHKIAEGAADKSYGIHVASIAGLPQKLLKRADLILQKLENQSVNILEDKMAEQLELFEVNDKPTSDIRALLEDIDPMNMTPIEALTTLIELKRKL